PFSTQARSSFNGIKFTIRSGGIFAANATARARSMNSNQSGLDPVDPGKRRFPPLYRAGSPRERPFPNPRANRNDNCKSGRAGGRESECPDCEGQRDNVRSGPPCAAAQNGRSRGRDQASARPPVPYRLPPEG